MALVTAPAFYPRALLLSLLALQFAQLFFGRTPALTDVIASTSAMGSCSSPRGERGIGIGWAEQAWMVAIYLLVALNGMALHASANRRLADARRSVRVARSAATSRGRSSKRRAASRTASRRSVTRTTICAHSSRRWCTPIRSPAA